MPYGSVPFLFFVAALLGALFTLNALSPARRWWPLVGPGFFAAWLTGELALHHLFWQMLAAGLFLWAGALVGWPGYAGMGLAVASWSGLVVLLVEARKAREVMEVALRETLGEGYRDEIDADLRSELDETWTLRQRLFPLPVWDPRVERVRDIVYHRAGGVNLRLDVYRPRVRHGLRPTILHVHGGAWMVGRKDDQGKPFAYRMAAHGWVCISANYRLSPRFTFPDHLIDVKAALAWIREHGAEYGADPDFVVITGGSAGGHLAALAALTPNDPEYQPGFEGAETSVQACVPFYGVYDFTDRRGIWERSLLRRLLERHILKKRWAESPADFEKASPMSRVGEGAPPFFVVHGTRDTLVPVADARLFVELLRAVSQAPVLFAELPGAQHAFEIFPSERTGHVIAGVERFLAWTYTRWAARHHKPVLGPATGVENVLAALDAVTTDDDEVAAEKADTEAARAGKDAA